MSRTCFCSPSVSGSGGGSLAGGGAAAPRPVGALPALTGPRPSPGPCPLPPLSPVPPPPTHPALLCRPRWRVHAPRLPRHVLDQASGGAALAAAGPRRHGGRCGGSMPTRLLASSSSALPCPALHHSLCCAGFIFPLPHVPPPRRVDPARHRHCIHSEAGVGQLPRAHQHLDDRRGIHGRGSRWASPGRAWQGLWADLGRDWQQQQQQRQPAAVTSSFRAAEGPISSSSALAFCTAAVNTGHFVLIPTPAALRFAAAWHGSALASVLRRRPALTDQKALQKSPLLTDKFFTCKSLCACYKTRFGVSCTSAVPPQAHRDWRLCVHPISGRAAPPHCLLACLPPCLPACLPAAEEAQEQVGALHGVPAGLLHVSAVHAGGREACRQQPRAVCFDPAAPDAHLACAGTP